MCYILDRWNNNLTRIHKLIMKVKDGDYYFPFYDKSLQFATCPLDPKHSHNHSVQPTCLWRKMGIELQRVTFEEIYPNFLKWGRSRNIFLSLLSSTFSKKLYGSTLKQTLLSQSPPKKYFGTTFSIVCKPHTY